jgi:8-amino-7-oxononanoate synthase
LLEFLQARLRERDAQHLTRRLREAGSPTAPRQTVDGEPRLMFCSNDYLGLASHPRVVAALQEGARRWGGGAGGAALISGHATPHRLLEERLATWAAPHIPGARCLSLGTGYMANLAVVSALGVEGGALFCEALNHASLIDGARLARATKHIYRSRDELAAQLAASAAPHKLIVTDAVFSMDGHLAELPALLQLAEQHDALLVVDDAHGFGVLGERGHGSLSHFGLQSERLVWMGTLGKAAGVAGAFVAAHATVIDWLLQTARPYIFTTAAPPLLAHALLTSLDLIEGEDGERRRAQLDLLRLQLREGLQPLCAARGWRLPGSSTAIQPLVVGHNEGALALAEQLESRGLRVPAIRPPTVPAGSARLRITLCAAHRSEDLDQLLEALHACT